MKPENAPKSALDFLKGEFRGKMIACYPHDDDATLYLFHTIAQKYGADYIDKYVANQPNWVQGHLGVSRSVAGGTDLVTPDATTSTVLNLKKAGQSIEFAFSEVDPIPVYYSTAGIFKDAPHPNVAKLYLTWVLAPEQQRRIGTFSSRSMLRLRPCSISRRPANRSNSYSPKSIPSRSTTPPPASSRLRRTPTSPCSI
jgi:ABC-type Fe3+ transport system substrate-binding protein